MNDNNETLLPIGFHAALILNRLRNQERIKETADRDEKDRSQDNQAEQNPGREFAISGAR